ncbi:MAG: hypothetical protein KatS3mg090_0758 [Patescibacteria group bacterium]|nr:MAG: hypothetical protein KatS3mg090_0758 [Patescibacteria group bacterium]
MRQNNYTPLDLKKYKQPNKKIFWLFIFTFIVLSIFIAYSYIIRLNSDKSEDNFIKQIATFLNSQEILKTELTTEVFHSNINNYLTEPTLIKSNTIMYLNNTKLYSNNQIQLNHLNTTEAINLELYLNSNLYLKINKLDFLQSNLDKLNLMSFYNLLINQPNLYNKWLKTNIAIESTDFKKTFIDLLAKISKAGQYQANGDQQTVVTELKHSDLRKISLFFDYINNDVKNILFKISFNNKNKLLEISAITYFNSEATDKVTIKINISNNNDDPFAKLNIGNALSLNQITTQNKQANTDEKIDQNPSTSEFYNIKQSLDKEYLLNLAYPNNLYEFKLITENQFPVTAFFSNNKEATYLAFIEENDQLYTLSNDKNFDNKTISRKEIKPLLDKFKFNDKDRFIYEIINKSIY